MTQKNVSYLQNRLTDTETRFAVAKEEGEWGKDGVGIWDYQMQTIISRLDATSLALQCLRFHTSTAWCAGLIAGGTKILPAVQYSKKKGGGA